MAFLRLKSSPIAFLLLTIVSALNAEVSAVDEYRVKAAYLFNFAKFVEWPAEKFQDAGAPINICVLGQNPFGSALEDIVRNKVVANRSFALRNVSESKQATGCHILFAAASNGKRSRVALEELRENAILTVGETEDFLANGGIVTLRLRDNNVRFDIDRDAAARAKLRISSKLLNLAENTRK